MKNNNGFSMVEALVSMVIIGFVIMSILSGFSHHQLTSRNISSKNVAISVAETRLEEIMKFTGSQLQDLINDGTFQSNMVDYIVQTSNSLSEPFLTDPQKSKQFRRTTSISPDPVDLNMMIVAVRVDYGKANNIYPFKVTISTSRRWE